MLVQAGDPGVRVMPMLRRSDRRWKARVLVCAVVVVAGRTTIAGALPAPDEARAASDRVAPAARALIDPLPRERVADDAEFVRVLQGVVERRDLPLDAQVDAFTLMLRKIGWLFNGTAALPPGFGYARLFTGQLSTFLRYQQAMAGSHVAGGPFVELARRQCASEAMRCASALLLAGIVDREAVRGALPSLLAAPWIAQSAVPPLTLHALAQVAVLARDSSLVAPLAALLATALDEEEQEDVLSAIAVYDLPAARATLEAFVVGGLDRPFDQAFETAVVLLRRRIEPRRFDELFARLVAASSGGMQDALLGMRARGFREGKIGPIHKVWDGFSIVVYDDGMLTTYGERFRDFEPSARATTSPASA
jgi:hypothetical protein